MLRQSIILTSFILISCGQTEKTDKTVDINTEQKEVAKEENGQKVITRKEDKIGNALTFINAYADNSNKMNEAVGIVDWVSSNSLVTQDFKAGLKKTIDDAYKQDPELGLDADPIFDAQDHPNGFVLESFDDKTNYLTVKGKDWEDFKLTMKIVDQNGNWLVDGCGIIRIPNNKRASR